MMTFIRFGQSSKTTAVTTIMNHVEHLEKIGEL